ncbi:MAG: serine/threonine protein kinase [Rhodanobacteraceae bacterium]|nr:serine/threonine protein kinase [Rhodanobacteraceae bacterium]
MTARELASRWSSLDAASRENQLHELRGRDPQLAREVEALLAAVTMETAAPEAGSDAVAPADLERIGPYRILERIGSGGMGSVYLALQPNPERRVALKTIRQELASPRLRERFAHEARFLAALEHPGIARVYESGSAMTADGELPYLAMEYVAGQPLLEAARRGAWSLEKRVGVLIALAEAVQHAHVRGIVHRDLKPANILVDEHDQPKILDFGVARAIDVEPTASARLTFVGEVVGTLYYMSPEQLSGDPTRVDARSDVYALGVIAYELLSGELPYAETENSLIEVIRSRESTPPRPLAERHPEFRGELDIIVMKALAGDIQARYQSAQALAEDLTRFLEHRPILARAPSAWYLLAKFTRRNRVAVAAAAVVLLALIAATVFSLRAADEATRALAEATARGAELTAVNGFVEQMLVSADPESGGSQDRPLSEVLDGAERALDSERSPRTAGQVAMLLARTWSGLGDSERVDRLLARAQPWVEQGFGARSPERFELESMRAIELGKRGDPDAALAAFDGLLRDMQQAGLDPGLAADQIRLAQAQVMQAKGEAQAAVDLINEVLARNGPTLARESPEEYDGARYNLAFAQLFLGDFPAAEALLREVMAGETERLGADHPQTLYTVKALGQALHRQGRLAEAEPLYRMVYEKRKAAYGPEHRTTLNAATQLAAGLVSLKRPAEAEPILREVIQAMEARDEQRSPQFVANLNILAGALAQLDQLDEALALTARGMAIEKDIGAPNQDTLAARNQHATLLLRLGRVSAASAEFAELLPLVESTLGREHIHYATFSSQAAACDLAEQQYERARQRLEAVLPALEARFGPGHPRTREAYQRLAQAHAGLGDEARAAEFSSKADAGLAD